MVRGSKPKAPPKPATVGSPNGTWKGRGKGRSFAEVASAAVDVVDSNVARPDTENGAECNGPAGDAVAALQEKLSLLEACKQGVDGPFQKHVEEEEFRIRGLLENAREVRREAKSVAQRRSELDSQLRSIETKLARNVQLHEEAVTRAKELESYVQSQTAKRGCIQEELRQLAVKEAVEATAKACPASSAEQHIVSQLASLQQQLAALRQGKCEQAATQQQQQMQAAVCPTRCELLGAQLFVQSAAGAVVPGSAPFGARIPHARLPVHSKFEEDESRRARSASPGKAKARRFFGAP